DAVQAELRAAAQRAILKVGSAKTMAVTTPVRAALRAVHPASLAALKGVPGIDYADDKVSFTAPDFGAAYDGLIALTNVATGPYLQVMFEAVRKRRDGEQLWDVMSDALLERWFDNESGRYTLPSPPPTAAGKKYHGAN